MIAWQLLVEPAGRPGAENMAIDQALLEEADQNGAAFLRLYGWNPACLSLGRNEPAAKRYDRELLERRGLAVVRRPTGGRAVWHEHEVTYAVAAPIAAFGTDPSRGTACRAPTYRAIHERLAAALRALGVDATLAPDRRDRLDRSGACFSSPVGGEVLVGGRKVIGSAQVRHGTALLQHGSILLDGSQEIVNAVSRQPSAVRGATTLREALGRPVTFDEVVEAILGAWDAPLQPTVRPSDRPSAFADPAWTWRR